MKKSIYTEAQEALATKQIVTIATGVTAAFLGDERNLREFVVADETAKHLRNSGHAAVTLLFNDNMDGLTFRQLRVAVNKDPILLEKYADWVGKPISMLPDPFGCHASFSAHFESELMGRLHHLGCHPTPVSVASLYANGLYTKHVANVFNRYDEIYAFLFERFEGYQPEALFYPICADCGRIDETKIDKVANGEVTYTCAVCETTHTESYAEIRGKMSWKLDCALRWSLFGVDAEPFSKAYLEPKAGSFVVAQELSIKFFGGREIFPIRYGQVKMERALSGTILPSVPGSVLRSLFTERATTDLHMTRDMIIATASSHDIPGGINYLDFVKQMLPIWMLGMHELTSDQRQLVAEGLAFSTHFLDLDVSLRLPRRENIEGEDPQILRALRSVLSKVIEVRLLLGDDYDAYLPIIKDSFADLGANRRRVQHRVRVLVGQEHGLPVTRILFVLPLGYLRTLNDMVGLFLDGPSLSSMGTLTFAGPTANAA